MLTFKKLFLIFVTTTFLLSATGCGKEEPAEKAGKKIEEAADSAKKKLKKLID